MIGQPPHKDLLEKDDERGVPVLPRGIHSQECRPGADLGEVRAVCGGEMALSLNKRVNPTTGAKVEFDDTEKKNIIQLERGHDMMDLFKHMG